MTPLNDRLPERTALENELKGYAFPIVVGAVIFALGFGLGSKTDRPSYADLPLTRGTNSIISTNEAEATGPWTYIDHPATNRGALDGLIIDTTIPAE